jgi:hypothetical protein
VKPPPEVGAHTISYDAPLAFARAYPVAPPVGTPLTAVGTDPVTPDVRYILLFVIVTAVKVPVFA